MVADSYPCDFSIVTVFCNYCISFYILGSIPVVENSEVYDWESPNVFMDLYSISAQDTTTLYYPDVLPESSHLPQSSRIFEPEADQRATVYWSAGCPRDVFEVHAPDCWTHLLRWLLQPSPPPRNRLLQNTLSLEWIASPWLPAILQRPIALVSTSLYQQERFACFWATDK